MVKIKYIGKFQPKEIVEVSEEKATELISLGSYKYVNEEDIPKELPRKLSKKDKKRIDNFTEDLKDDGKRNYSNK